MPSWRSPPGSIATGPIRCRLSALVPEQRGLVQAVKAYEELTIRAATRGDRRSALLALGANPLVGAEVARPLLDALLEANRGHLPRFAS